MDVAVANSVRLTILELALLVLLFWQRDRRQVKGYGLRTLAIVFLAGILGMFLAAPILASLRIAGNYVRCKLLDLEPFPAQPVQEDIEEPAPLQEEKGETDVRAE